MMKRALAILLAVATALALCAIPASAAEPEIIWLEEGLSPEGKFSDGLLQVWRGHEIEFVDKEGNVVIPPEYGGRDSSHGFSEGLAVVRKGEMQFGYIDTTGRLVIPMKSYYAVYPFSEGLAMVDDGDNTGYIDTTGKLVIPMKYRWGCSFSEGLALVSQNGTDGFFIDKTGKKVIDLKNYLGTNGFFDGLAAVQGKNYKFGFIDKTGKLVIPMEYDYTEYFSEGLASVQKGSKYGFIDTAGQLVTPLEYEYAKDFSEGLAPVSWTIAGLRKWGFIDQIGQVAVWPEYDSAEPFSEGLAAVCYDNKWGYIDRTGQVVVPLEYDYVGPFSEGVAVVQKDGRYGILKNPLTAAPVPLAYPSAQSVNVDGESVDFAMYALKDENGNPTNYIRVRDLAAVLNGTAAQFNVGWSGNVLLTTGQSYTGSAEAAPFDTEMRYTDYQEPTYVNSEAVSLEAIQIEYNGGGYTYYKLRDLGAALGFNVGWSADKGVFLETDRPYNAND